MRVRLLNLIERIRGSLWFVPGCMSVAATALAFATSRLDWVVATSGEEWPRTFLYNGDLQGARTLLGTVASSMITVAGVTFSITVVALSLASSQFGPRLLSSFMRDRGNQLVLGTFIATFLFCIVALGRGGSASGETVVIPAVSATAAVLLAVTSLAVLIYFIHHVASSIRAEHVVDAVARDLDEAIQHLLGGLEDEEDDADEETESLADDVNGATVVSRLDGYIQAVDEEGLFEIAEKEDLVLRLERRAGHFVVEGALLALVVDADEVADPLAQRIRRCFLIGRQRTGEQDPEYGVHQLVEVALRALSPGINDPYTAISCINWLSAVLCKVARHDLRVPQRRGEDGAVRVYGNPITFTGLLDAAFDQIRQNARPHPSVSIRLLEVFGAIAEQIDEADRRRAVRRQADMTFEGALSREPQEKDREALEARYRRVVEVLEE